MKTKTLFLAVIFTAALSLCLFADNRYIFTEYSVSYASVLTPHILENNTTGVYDTAAFDAKVGADILRWADIYVGGDFMFFMMRPDMTEHYSFYPIYGGIHANICPDFKVYPGIFFELGKAISNQRTGVNVMTPFGQVSQPVDHPWTGTYYNFGFDLNMNVNDISILSFRIDRPAISNKEDDLGEIHIIRVGFAWKTLY